MSLRSRTWSQRGSPSGTQMILASGPFSSSIQKIPIGRPRTQQPGKTGSSSRTTGHNGAVMALAIAPDGRGLASADHGAVRIWDLTTDRLQALYHVSLVRAVAIAPDGRWLASVGRDGTVRIWDLTADGISAVMRVDSWLGDCAWSPFSQSLAAAGGVGLYYFTLKR